MIPKILHYCWLGGKEKPVEIQKYMESWKKYAPDFEIKEWNEENFPFDEIKSEYIDQAVSMGKWAFVTDVMRLYVLQKYGGVYFDTDVELLRPLDSLLDNSSFIGFESDYTLCTAVIGACQDQRWLEELLNIYRKRCFVDERGKLDTIPNSQFIYQYFHKNCGLEVKKDIFLLQNGLKVYPNEYFSPLNYSTMKINITENTYTVHHYSGAWKSQGERRKDWIKAMITRVIGEKGRETIKRILKGQ